MKNRIKITNVINTERKILKLKKDVLSAALLLYELGRPDWFISHYANTKLNFLNSFIELKAPFNNDISSKNLIYTRKSSLSFNIDLFDIFVTDYYNYTNADTKKIIENSPLKPFNASVQKDFVN